MLPWLDRLRQDIPGLELFDAHTHIGRNDPDGFKQEPEQLLGHLDAAGARALVFPMHEPDPGGYTRANDEVRAAVEASGGLLVRLARVNPRDGALAEARRSLDEGAIGFKLHPRAEQFSMRESVVAELVALAHERRAPILVHAGRGIPALGRDILALSERFPDARFILAHAAITDLAWIWRELPEHPNVMVDTSWWNPVDLTALLTLVSPGQILWASDSPYGTPVLGAILTLRCALAAGLTVEQVRGVASGQLERVIAGADLLELGPAPGDPGHVSDVLVDRVADYLMGAMQRYVAEADDEEPLALARLACAVPEDAPEAPICRSILALLDAAAEQRALPPDGRQRFSDLHPIVCALAVARTPTVPIPEI